MPSTSSNTIIGSALLVAVAAATVLYSSNTVLSDNDDSEYSEHEEFISAEEVCTVFDRLVVDMKMARDQLAEQVKKVQQSEQRISAEQLRYVLADEFGNALRIKKHQILDEYDMDEDCLEDATWVFLRNPEEYPNVTKSVKCFQQLCDTIPSYFEIEETIPVEESKEPESADVLSEDETIEATAIYFTALTAATDQWVKTFKTQGKDLRDASLAHELHLQVAFVAENKAKEALRTAGFTYEQMTLSTERNAHSSRVQRSLATLKMKHEATLMSLGVP